MCDDDKHEKPNNEIKSDNTFDEQEPIDISEFPLRYFLRHRIF